MKQDDTVSKARRSGIVSLFAGLSALLLFVWLIISEQPILTNVALTLMFLAVMSATYGLIQLAVLQNPQRRRWPLWVLFWLGLVLIVLCLLLNWSFVFIWEEPWWLTLMLSMLVFLVFTLLFGLLSFIIRPLRRFNWAILASLLGFFLAVGIDYNDTGYFQGLTMLHFVWGILQLGWLVVAAQILLDSRPKSRD